MPMTPTVPLLVLCWLKIHQPLFSTPEPTVSHGRKWPLLLPVDRCTNSRGRMCCQHHQYSLSGGSSLRGQRKPNQQAKCGIESKAGSSWGQKRKGCGHWSCALLGKSSPWCQQWCGVFCVSYEVYFGERIKVLYVNKDIQNREGFPVLKKLPWEPYYGRHKLLQQQQWKISKTRCCFSTARTALVLGEDLKEQRREGSKEGMWTKGRTRWMLMGALLPDFTSVLSSAPETDFHSVCSGTSRNGLLPNKT